MASVRKKWKSSPALIRFTWNETRRMIGSSWNARNGAPSTRATPARTCLTGRPSAGAPSAQCGGRRRCVDKRASGAARIGPRLGTMPGWPCCASPRSPPSTATSTTRRAASRGPRRPTSCTRWSTTQEREVGTYLLGRRMYETHALLGDRPRRRARADGRVRPDLARRPTRSSTPPASRTSRPRAPARRVVRPGRGRGAQGVERARRQRRRADPRGRGVPRRPGRRGAPVPAPRGGRRWHPGAARRRARLDLDLVAVDRIGEVVHLHHRVRR